MAGDRIDLIKPSNVKLLAHAFRTQDMPPLFEYYCPESKMFELEDVRFLPIYGYVVIIRCAELVDVECPGLPGIIAQLEKSPDREDESLSVQQASFLRHRGWVEM